MVNGWKYYNHAAIPTTGPNEVPYLKPVLDGSIFRERGVLLAKWESEWDCGDKTDWWYCIKDTPFEIERLKSKRRYEINKGNNSSFAEARAT